jgi:hypothetical protein
MTESSTNSSILGIGATKVEHREGNENFSDTRFTYSTNHVEVNHLEADHLEDGVLAHGAIEVRRGITFAERLGTLSTAMKIFTTGEDSGLVTLASINSPSLVEEANTQEPAKNILIQYWNFASGNYTEIAQTVVDLSPNDLATVLINKDNTLTFVMEGAGEERFVFNIDTLKIQSMAFDERNENNVPQVDRSISQSSLTIPLSTVPLSAKNVA